MEDEIYFWVYILECSNGSYYTGYAKNIIQRYYKHKSGTSGAKFVNAFKVSRLMQCWRIYDTKSSAMKIESIIKSLSRNRKEELIVSPEKLLKLAAEKIEKSIEIYPFNPELVEREMKLANDIKPGINISAFDSLPPGTI